eukprot:Amastigsp_a513289_12.p3 type:complete len:141 gc:universal Amastigsp_a513289_12:864-1286(+)
MCCSPRPCARSTPSSGCSISSISRARESSRRPSTSSRPSGLCLSTTTRCTSASASSARSQPPSRPSCPMCFSRTWPCSRGSTPRREASLRALSARSTTQGAQSSCASSRTARLASAPLSHLSSASIGSQAKSTPSSLSSR